MATVYDLCRSDPYRGHTFYNHCVRAGVSGIVCAPIKVGDSTAFTPV